MWFHRHRIGGILANVNVNTSFKEDFVESMANLIGSFHEFHEFQKRFRWKYGQLERGREFPRVPKKISLKVWPTFRRRFRWKYGQRFKDFVESMANVSKIGSFHEFHEFQRRFRRKYGQRFKDDLVESMANVSKKSTTFWEQRTAT